MQNFFTFAMEYNLIAGVKTFYIHKSYHIQGEEITQGMYTRG